MERVGICYFVSMYDSLLLFVDGGVQNEKKAHVVVVT